MSSNSVIIDKYAKAAFQIAQKSNLQDVFLNDLNIFYKNIEASLGELANPAISRTQLANIIADVAEKLKTNDILKDFLVVVAKSRRINLIEKIYKKLEILVKKDKNILQVELISAKKLREEQVEETLKVLKTRYPENEIEIAQSIKEDILGGVVIKIGSFVIDTSIKSQLQEIYNDCQTII